MKFTNEIKQKELKIIQKVETILSDESNWTQQGAAIDINGCVVEADNPRACAWCLSGAMKLAAYRLTGEVSFYNLHAYVAKAMLRLNKGERLIPYFNDSPRTSHANVMNVVRETKRLLLLKANPSDGCWSKFKPIKLTGETE